VRVLEREHQVNRWDLLCEGFCALVFCCETNAGKVTFGSGVKVTVETRESEMINSGIF